MVGSTYDGHLITPQSLLALMPPLPKKHRADLALWMAIYKTTLEDLCTFAPPYCGPQGTFIASKEQCRKDLLKIGLRDVGASNVLIPLKFSSGKFMVRIVGRVHVATNLLRYNGHTDRVNPLPATDAQCDDEIKEIVPTYQGMSRAAYYLRFIEAVKKMGITNVKTPPTYIVPLEDSPAAVCDQNAIIVQGFIDTTHLRLLKDLIPGDVRKLKPEDVRKLILVMIYSGFWDITGNVGVDQDGNFVDVDLEQSDTSSPSDFFHKNKFEMLINIRRGIKQLKHLMAANIACKKVCKEFAGKSLEELLAIIAS